MLKGAYEKMIMDNFRNDPLIVEAMRLVLHRFFYKKDTKYYRVIVVDFYDLEKKKYSTQMKNAYMINGKKKVFNIYSNKISCIDGVFWK